MAGWKSLDRYNRRTSIACALGHVDCLGGTGHLNVDVIRLSSLEIWRKCGTQAMSAMGRFLPLVTVCDFFFLVT